MNQSPQLHPDRNLAMELVRATEAAAIKAFPYIGKGKKNESDGAAVDAMRAFLGTVNFEGLVVIGEGEKDDAPMLFNGELVGNGQGPKVDIAVDPIDGTSLTAAGRNNAISVIAVADRGSMLDASAVYKMNKLVTGPAGVGVCDIRLPIAGVGGSPEGIVTACGIRALGGFMQGILTPREDFERERGAAAGLKFDYVYEMNEMVSSDNTFFVATGVTDGALLSGVKKKGDMIFTESIVIRGRSGTVRKVFAEYQASRWI
jgi:fructose-1,6-bisphosphatase II